MLNGFGVNNPMQYEGFSMVYGDISNVTTGAQKNDNGLGIDLGPEAD